MRARLIAVIGVVGLLATAGVAHAEKAADKAKKHYKQGTVFYNAGDFDKAIQEYLEGYRTKPDPVFLFNVAQSYRQLGNHEKALFYYKGYLREAPDAPNRAEVEERVRDLDDLIKRRREATDSPPSGPAEPPLTGTPAEGDEPKIPDPADAAAAGDDEGAPPAGPGLVDQGGGSRPIYKKWWFWTAIGVVAVGATVGIVMATSGDDVSPPDTAGGNLSFF